MIEIKELDYSYPDGTLALDGVNLCVGRDETAVLIGQNGAGKTTLLQLLIGISMPKKGRVILEGLLLNDDNLKKIRQKAGLVFQNPDDMLFSPTVFEDVAFGPRNMGLKKSEVLERVRDSLKSVGMSGFEDKNPHHLSLGQKKRVSLASVLSMKPEIIAFDEPTSHLDPKGKREITELIFNIPGTKIISTHDMDLIKYADMVHVMDNGRIVHSAKKITKQRLAEFGLI